MEPYELTQLHQRIRNAVALLNLLTHVEVREVTPIAGQLFWVELILEQGYRLRPLMIDTGYEVLLYLEPQDVRYLISHGRAGER